MLRHQRQKILAKKSSLEEFKILEKVAFLVQEEINVFQNRKAKMNCFMSVVDTSCILKKKRSAWPTEVES